MVRRLSVFLLTMVALVTGASIVCQAQELSLLTRHVRQVTRNGQAQFVGRLPATQSISVAQLRGGGGDGEATEHGDTARTQAGGGKTLSGGGPVGTPPDPRRLHPGLRLSNRLGYGGHYHFRRCVRGHHYANTEPDAIANAQSNAITNAYPDAVTNT